jgi:uncharacterized protein YydD (DUF2326 family)
MPPVLTLGTHIVNCYASPDLAVLRAHLNDKFPRFVYHDGVFESLDDRKKENLLSVIRQYADLGLQTIITLIDSDLPTRSDSLPVFIDDEIILKLHDENEQGHLFKIKMCGNIWNLTCELPHLRYLHR